MSENTSDFRQTWPNISQFLSLKIRTSYLVQKRHWADDKALNLWNVWSGTVSALVEHKSSTKHFHNFLKTRRATFVYLLHKTRRSKNLIQELQIEKNVQSDS